MEHDKLAKTHGILPLFLMNNLKKFRVRLESLHVATFSTKCCGWKILADVWVPIAQEKQGKCPNKFPVRENTENLEIVPKHREF